ncbi:MAG: thioredoxin family protein [Actinomycetota bacterium]|nr:thioredoxin family protein [Actinomycetota bacterium]
MNIKILGGGCANCDRLEKVTREAAASLGLDATFEKVADFQQIMAYGVMTTPALVVDEQVKVAGRVPSAEEVARLLQGAADAGTGGCGCGGSCC